MSEKDIKKCLTDADLDNVSGGQIETSKTKWGNKLYRAVVDDKVGDWNITRLGAERDENKFMADLYKKEHPDA